MTNERGTALIEMVIVGFTVLAVVLPILVGTAHLADASSDVHVAAVDAALWTARHGSLPADVDDDIDIAIDERDGNVVVRASTDISVFGGAGSWGTIHMSASAVVPISPYRSGS